MPCVVFVAPSAAQSVFKRVVRALGGEVEPSYHSMLLSTISLPDPAWTLSAEAEALRRAVEGRARFHMVAFSGGATVVLRYLATRDRLDRIQSLTLVEPPWVGTDMWSDNERAFVDEFDRLVTLGPADRWEAFATLYAPGAALPPPPDIERAALELEACWRGYRAEALDRESLRSIDVPVYLPVAGRSPRRMVDAARLLAGVFPRARVETFEGRGHFDLLFTEAEAVAAGIRRCFA
jgi:pimeloyl-ACP methyl ester carboxylesterase